MEKVKLEGFNIIGISIRTTNENDQSAKDISALWARFMSEQIIDKIPNKIDRTIYALYTGYESDHTKPYTTILGCKVDKLRDIPAGMDGQSFEGHNYMKSTVKGDLLNGLISNHWSSIFEMGLNRSFKVDFEVYGEKAQNPSDAEVTVYVSVNS